jgi:hypothetical protein
MGVLFAFQIAESDLDCARSSSPQKKMIKRKTLSCAKTVPIIM